MCKFCPIEVQLAFLATEKVEKVNFACHLYIYFTLPDLWVCALWILLCNIFLLVVTS